LKLLFCLFSLIIFVPFLGHELEIGTVPQQISVGHTYVQSAVLQFNTLRHK
jgi:hypothetical protein